MGFGLELLRDGSSYKKSFITRVDPRIKFIYCFLFLSVIIVSKNIFVMLSILSFMVTGLFLLNVKKKIFLIRGLPALLIAVTILITQVFLYGQTVLFSADILGIQITGYREGLDRGLLLMCRVLAGISTVLLLTLSTSINKLIYAARWLHLPQAFLEVLTLTYRYIFVFSEEVVSVKNAQKTRLGYSSYGRSLKSLGNISGIIIIRTIDKSEKLYKAMKSRGYNGQQIAVQYNAGLMRSDWIISACLAAFWVIMIIISL